MVKEMKQRDSFVDILKGIGIVSIVIGHSGVGAAAARFVYLYHLMIFFFAAGMVWNPQKYTDPYQYIGRQLKASVPLYVGYNLLFVWLHNLVARLHLLDVGLYGLPELVVNSSLALAFMQTESLMGAMWFVPMFLLAKSFFAIAFTWAQRQRVPAAAHGMVIVLFGAIGLYTNTMGMNIYYQMQTAFLGVPILYLGYAFGRMRSKLTGLLHPVVCAVSAVSMMGFLRLNIGSIELSQEQIISPLLFYPVTVLGIVFCLSLARLLQRCKVTETVMAWLGTISFHIMALHFAVFKCFDVVLARLFGIPWQNAMAFPTAFSGVKFGMVYSLIGVAAPAVWILIVRMARKYIQQRSGSKPTQ